MFGYFQLCPIVPGTVTKSSNQAKVTLSPCLPLWRPPLNFSLCSQLLHIHSSWFLKHTICLLLLQSILRHLHSPIFISHSPPLTNSCEDNSRFSVGSGISAGVQMSLSLRMLYRTSRRLATQGYVVPSFPVPAHHLISSFLAGARLLVCLPRWSGVSSRHCLCWLTSWSLPCGTELGPWNAAVHICWLNG